LVMAIAAGNDHHGKPQSSRHGNRKIDLHPTLEFEVTRQCGCVPHGCRHELGWNAGLVTRTDHRPE
jgi:hypothetical protein